MTNLVHRFAPFNRQPLAARYKDVNDKDDDGFRGDDEASEAAKFIRDAYRDANGDKPVSDDDKEAKAEARLNALSSRPDSDAEKQAACAALIRAFIPKGRR